MMMGGRVNLVRPGEPSVSRQQIKPGTVRRIMLYRAGIHFAGLDIAARLLAICQETEPEA
jgi:hypothetical protein